MHICICMYMHMCAFKYSNHTKFDNLMFTKILNSTGYVLLYTSTCSHVVWATLCTCALDSKQCHETIIIISYHISPKKVSLQSNNNTKIKLLIILHFFFAISETATSSIHCVFLVFHLSSGLWIQKRVGRRQTMKQANF